MKLLVEDGVVSWEDKENGTVLGGKTGWWLKYNWLRNAGVEDGEAKFAYTYPKTVGKLPKRKKKDTSPVIAPALGIWDSVGLDVPLLLISNESAMVRCGIPSVANWHGHIDVVEGRVTGCTLSPVTVRANANYLPLVIKETTNLLDAARAPSLLARPSVVKGIVPYAAGEVVFDMEWEYSKRNKIEEEKSGKVTVVGLAYEEGKGYSSYDARGGMEVIGRKFSEGVRVIGHNIINADIPKLVEAGFSGPRSYHPDHIIDTMVVGHIVHAHWSGLGLYGLEDLVRYYRPTTAWKHEKGDLLEYNGFDAIYNYRLWKDLEIDLGVTDQWHLVEKDQRLAAMANLMRVRGMRIDSEGLRGFRIAWAERRKQIAKGFPFSPTSWQQIKKYFAEQKVKLSGTAYDVLVKAVRRGDAYTKRLSRIGADGSLLYEDGFDLTNARWPELNKLIEFKDEGKGVATWFDEVAIGLGRIHPKFNVTGTAVARFSSSGPNAQNVPPEYRAFILAQNDDEFLASYDGKNIEGRTVARQANDTQMLGDFASGADIHSLTASRIFSRRFEDVTKDERQAGKKTVHASNYRETAPSLAGRLYGDSSRASIAKAQRLQDGYFAAYSGIKAWQDNLERQMSQGDIWLRNSFGRMRAIYAENDHERTKRACHFLGCSDGAEVVNQRALDVWDATGYFPQSIVHDELLYSLPKGAVGKKADAEITAILNSPIKQMDGFVIPFESKYSENYGFKEKYDPNGGGYE